MSAGVAAVWPCNPDPRRQLRRETASRDLKANFDYFGRLVKDAFMDEKAVVDMLEVMAEQARLAPGGRPFRVSSTTHQGLK